MDAPSTIPATVIPITAALITQTRFIQPRRCMDIVPLRSIRHRRSMYRLRYSGLTIVRAAVIAGTTGGMAGMTGGMAGATAVVNTSGATADSVRMGDLECQMPAAGMRPGHGADPAKT